MPFVLVSFLCPKSDHYAQRVFKPKESQARSGANKPCDAKGPPKVSQPDYDTYLTFGLGNPTKEYQDI